MPLALRMAHEEIDMKPEIELLSECLDVLKELGEPVVSVIEELDKRELPVKDETRQQSARYLALKGQLEQFLLDFAPGAIK